MPGDDGLTLCKYVKANLPTPVLFLTARRRDLDEIIGLEVGADDYITKPFNLDVLKAHVRALMRRPAASLVDNAKGEKLTVGGFILEPAFHSISLDGKAIDLSPKEFKLMRFFLSNPNQVFTTDELIENVWGEDFVGEMQVLYVQIHSLREKIEKNPSRPNHILTLRGVGYKFKP